MGRYQLHGLRLNGAGASAAELLEPTIKAGVAKNLAKAIPILGVGISALQAWQTGMDVIRETGSPLKGIAAFAASFAVSWATGEVIDVEVAAAVFAGAASGTAAIPAAADGTVAVALTTYEGDKFSEMLVALIKKLPVK